MPVKTVNSGYAPRTKQEVFEDIKAGKHSSDENKITDNQFDPNPMHELLKNKKPYIRGFDHGLQE